MRRLTVPLLSTLALALVASQATASLVYFDFFANFCDDNIAGSCEAYGLEPDGAGVYGTFAINSAYVIGGTTVDILSLPDTEFEFTFGPLYFTKDDLYGTSLAVTFSPDAQQIWCIDDPRSTQVCYDGYSNAVTTATNADGELLGIEDTFVIYGFDTDGHRAESVGIFTRRTGVPIPEPGAALLFAVGLALVSRRRA